MRTFLTVVALAVLCTAVPAAARAALAADPVEQCVCQADSGRAQQLIRGAGQVSRCEKGEYCDCQTKTVVKCDYDFPPLLGETAKFNEEIQQCDYTFECQAFFDEPTAVPDSPSTQRPWTPEPTEAAETTPAAPTPPPEPCSCKDASLPLQLIRGSSQLDRCLKGDYCDCQAKAVVKCEYDYPALLGETAKFNEEIQQCEYTFDCQYFFDGPTERPSTPKPSTPKPTEPAKTSPAAPTSPPAACSCQDASLPQQLIRGSSQVASCLKGQYCDCQTRTVAKCDLPDFLDTTAKFNEAEQTCDYTFDCQSYLQDVTAATTSRTVPTKAASTSTSGWTVSSAGSSTVVLSATLFTLTAVLTVFNLLMLYRRSCCGGAEHTVPYARHLSRPSPGMCSPAFMTGTSKAPLESAA